MSSEKEIAGHQPTKTEKPAVNSSIDGEQHKPIASAPGCFGEYDHDPFGKCIDCAFALACAQQSAGGD